MTTVAPCESVGAGVWRVGLVAFLWVASRWGGGSRATSGLVPGDASLMAGLTELTPASCTVNRMHPVQWEYRPDGLRAPALVVAFKGWNDAADAASSALTFVAETLE